MRAAIAGGAAVALLGPDHRALVLARTKDTLVAWSAEALAARGAWPSRTEVRRDLHAAMTRAAEVLTGLAGPRPDPDLGNLVRRTSQETLPLLPAQTEAPDRIMLIQARTLLAIEAALGDAEGLGLTAAVADQWRATVADLGRVGRAAVCAAVGWDADMPPR